MKADFTPGAASRGCRSRAGPEPCTRSRSPCAPPESFNAWSWRGVPAPPWQSPQRRHDKGRIPAASLGAITKALGLPPRSQGGAQGGFGGARPFPRGTGHAVSSGQLLASPAGWRDGCAAAAMGWPSRKLPLGWRPGQGRQAAGTRL